MISSPDNVSTVFHVEMRMGLHVARAFNLGAHDLQVRFLGPLTSGQDFGYEGHEWAPGKTRLRIFDGPALKPHELGMGRGWQNAQRRGREVTEELLGQARAGRTGSGLPAAGDQLTQQVIGRLSNGPLALGETVQMAADLLEGRRVSEQLAAAETAVWNLLHTGGARLQSDGVEVARELWDALVLSPASWLGPDAEVLLLRPDS